MDIVSVPGRLVRDPVTRRVVDDTPLSIDPNEPYWVRMLADGDVAEAPDAPPATAPTPPAPAPAKAAAVSSQDASA